MSLPVSDYWFMSPPTTAADAIKEISDFEEVIPLIADNNVEHAQPLSAEDEDEDRGECRWQVDQWPILKCVGFGGVLIVCVMLLLMSGYDDEDNNASLVKCADNDVKSVHVRLCKHFPVKSILFSNGEAKSEAIDVRCGWFFIEEFKSARTVVLGCRGMRVISNVWHNANGGLNVTCSKFSILEALRMRRRVFPFQGFAQLRLNDGETVVKLLHDN